MAKLLWLFAVLFISVVANERETDSNPVLYQIEGVVRVPRGSKPSNTRILLNGGEYVAIPIVDGSFVVRNVPAGTYLLEVNSVQFAFDPLRIDVSARDNGKVRASPLFRKERLRYPLVLRSKETKDYFTPRDKFDIWGFVKSPMVIMMGMTLIIVVAFPIMLRNMDPAELEQFENQSVGLNIGDLLRGEEKKTIRASTKS